MNLKLVCASLIGAGSIGGVGVGTYYALKSEIPKSKISELITKSGRTILDKNAKGWDIKLDVYNKSQNKVTLPKDGEEGLKEWCKDTLNKEIEISKKDAENSNFKIALNLCTKPTNKEKLLKDSKTLARTNDWAKKQEAYRQESANTLDIPEIKNKSQATGEQISDWCSANIDKEVEDSENTYKIAEKWCVNS